MTDDTPEPPCPVCHRSAPVSAPAPHRWHWWELAPAALIAISMVGGWVWFLSGVSSRASQLDDRVGLLEHARDTQSTKIDGMSDRLARMEPMLDLVVKHLAPTKQ